MLFVDNRRNSNGIGIKNMLLIFIGNVGNERLFFIPDSVPEMGIKCFVHMSAPETPGFSSYGFGNRKTSLLCKGCIAVKDGAMRVSEKNGSVERIKDGFERRGGHR